MIKVTELPFPTAGNWRKWGEIVSISLSSNFPLWGNTSFIPLLFFKALK